MSSPYHVLNHKSISNDTILALKIYPYDDQVSQLIIAIATQKYVYVIHAKAPDFADISVKFTYHNEDKTECFYCVEWGIIFTDCMLAPVLLFSGEIPTIKVINYNTKKLHGKLTAHHNSVNDLKTHPNKLHIFLSASKDNSIILWNVQELQQIAIYIPLMGRLTEVTCISWHQNGINFAVALKCKCFKIFKLTQKILNHIKNPEGKAIIKYLPIYISDDFANGLIDCCEFIGSLLSVKSSNGISIVSPCPQLYSNAVSVMMLLNFESPKLLFSKYAVNAVKNVLAVSDSHGRINIFNLLQQNQCECGLLTYNANYIIPTPCQSLCRALEFSKSGKYLCCGNDVGSIIILITDK